MIVDKYILHISNTSPTDGAVTVASDNNEFEIRIPENIRSKGKCFVKVISGNMTIEHNGGSRIVNSHTRIVTWSSNMAYLGFSTEGRSSGNAILGSALISAAEKVVHLDSTNLPTFTCPQLPDILRIKKLMQGSVDINLTSANLYTTTLLPCNITLEITFDSDVENPSARELFSRRN